MNIPTFSACPFCGKPVTPLVTTAYVPPVVSVKCADCRVSFTEDIDAHIVPLEHGFPAHVETTAEAFLDAYNAALQKLADRWNMRGGFVERTGG